MAETGGGGCRYSHEDRHEIPQKGEVQKLIFHCLPWQYIPSTFLHNSECVFLTICYYQIQLIYARLVVFCLIYCKVASTLSRWQHGESHTLTVSDAKWFHFRDESIFFILHWSRETCAHVLVTKALVMWNDRPVTECHLPAIDDVYGKRNDISHGRL